MKAKKARKIKDFIKSKWTWFLTSGIFLLVGIAAIIVGAFLTGFNLIEWLQTPYALTFFICLGIGAVVLMIIIINYKRSHLGE